MRSEPWLPYLVTKFIKSLNPVTVFEWGSGESTLFFALELNSVLVSVEHDPDFYGRMTDELAKHKILSAYHLALPEHGEIGPDKSNPEHYKSGSSELGQVNFKRYASVIDSYGLFDLILIDGMARPSCLVHAISHVKAGGAIVLDNTGDRLYYLEKTEHLFGDYESGWEKIKFFGYGPILDYKWETTIFLNRTKNDY